MMMPVMVMPVMMVPVAMVPMMVVPVTVMMPVHLHRLHLIDFILRHDRRLDSHGLHRHGLGRDRRHGRGLCAGSKQDRACDQTSTEFQEIPKFHDFMPLPMR
jgi:hypothetical protein